MASIFEREPIFTYERPWDDSTKLPEKFKFSGTSGKSEVHVDSGSLGMEFFYEKTLPDFLQTATKLNWSWYETFSEFENVLAGSYKTAWREVVKDHFSDEAAIVETENDDAGFYKAIRLFACTILDSETPRDVQYVYLAPGGDHRIVKDLLTAPRDHARRFKEMLRITELLPPGETPPPSDKLAVQWYYMTYHKADRHEYVKSGKKLSDETIETLTAYFQSLFAQRKNDGTLERFEVERIRNRAKRILASDIREKREARRSNHARREARERERERGRHGGSRSHRRGNDDRRRDAYGGSGCDGCGRHNNQPKRGDRDGGGDRDKRRDDDDRGATSEKRAWKKDDNKKNRRDDRDRRDPRSRREKIDAHHLDNRYTSSDDETKNDDENTYVDNDDDVSRSTASSGVDDDNFAVALGTPEKNSKQAKRGSAITDKEVASRKRKSVAAMVPRKKKRTDAKVIYESNSDDGDEDDNFLASCGEALQRDPLDI